MKIAIIGTRGIPACYGGFETLAEELAVRLVRRGHRVTVYCRSHYTSPSLKEYKGVHLVVLPTIRHKYLDTVIHTFLSVFHGFFKGYEVILICNSVNALASFIPRLSGARVIVNVDGMDRKRKKWNSLGKLVYLISEYLVTFLPNAIITDTRFIQGYYQKRYRKDSTYIAYGGDLPTPTDTGLLRELGLEKGRYLLFVGRLEPENNAHRVIKAFEKVKTDMELVVLGDAPYCRNYIEELKSTRDGRIRFPGSIYGEGYRKILSQCYFSIRASEVGGIHPALLEAMGYGKCILASDNRQNRETIGEAGLYFNLDQEDELQARMQYLVDHPGVIAEYGAQARRRLEKYFTWDKVTDEYERLFYRTVID